jgi:hypothetical protein
MLAAALILPTTMFGQSATTGSLTGTVADPTGAVVPTATVELTSLDTNAMMTQQSNAAGQFTFSNVRPGDYKLTVKMNGFRTASVPNLKIEVNKSSNLDVKLDVGTDNQIVEVTAAASAQLQTVDAQIGNTITQDLIAKLPTLQRNVTELMNLQPGVVPVGNNLQSRTTGALDDQNTVTVDGIDVTAVVTAIGTSIPTPQDSVEEFRVAVSNPNANLTRASGGQMSLVGRHGSNTMHGSGYGFFQNSVLNSNTWDNNAARIRKPDIADKRYGGRWGGALIKNKTFLFTNYEARDFEQVQQANRTVPTDSLKAGILRFRDAANNIISYDLRTSRQCGPTGDQPCDPRGLGISPASRQQLGLMPASNLNSGGDGLNTLSYLANIATPVQDRYIVGRLDHVFSEKLTFNGSYTYFRRIQAGIGDISVKDQVSMVSTPQRGTLLTGSLTWQAKPTLINVSRFGFVRDVAPSEATAPSAAARLLNITGTNTAAGNIALLLGGGTTAFLDSPIDMDTQRARYQASYSRSYQYDNDTTYIKGTHTFAFGAQIRPIWYRHDRADKVVGSLTSLVANVDQGAFLTVPGASAPPTCTATLTVNCLRSADINNWGRFYSAVLGMVNDVGVLAVRDASLNPTPLGTNLVNITNSHAVYFNGQDTWRVTKALTLNYGFSYGWQTAPSDSQGRQTIQIDTATGQAVDPIAYLQNKLTAAQAGNVYNPTFGWVPVNDAKRPVFDTARGGFSPRASFAYNPTGDGLFGKIMGDRKTVLRGGFGLIFDRSNMVQNVLIPMLGVGFGQNVSVNGPRCNATTAGVGCDPTSSNPALSAYRVGVDGTIPLPTVGASTIPVVPQNFAETLSFQVDPNTVLGRSYNVDFSIQRELPGGWIVDAAYVGRFARKLPHAINLTQSPYMFKDAASGQTFAQAYDFIRSQLRAGTAIANIPNQPWFENQLRGFAPSVTQSVLTRLSPQFTAGNVSNIFLQLGRDRRTLGLQPYNNDQSQVEFMRTYIGSTNYNGLLLTVAKRMSKGLLVNANYTFSRAFDNGLLNQNNAGFYHNSFYPGTEYGPSVFDRTHVFNLNWVYELPAGKGHRFNVRGLDRVLGGWYVSGIATAFSGLPLVISDSAGAQSWGGATALGPTTGAIPTAPVETSLSAPITGTGFNLFKDGRNAINSFRPIMLSADERTGRANPIRGLPYKNLDLSIGKVTQITEKLHARFAADLFNAFNYVNYANPTQANLNITNPNTFGTVNASFIPPNRTNSARWIQLSIRLEF